MREPKITKGDRKMCSDNDGKYGSMKKWTRLLPLCLVAWYSKKYCEIWADGKSRYVAPFDDVRIYFNRQNNGKR